MTERGPKPRKYEQQKNDADDERPEAYVGENAGQAALEEQATPRKRQHDLDCDEEPAARPILSVWRGVTHGVIAPPNDPSSATRPMRRHDCNSDAMAGFAAAHG